MKLSRCLMVALTGLWGLSTLGAAPATPTAGEANRPGSFFDETFPDKKPPFPRFQVLPVASGKECRMGAAKLLLASPPTGQSSDT
jgi:hypothetical protein